MKRLKVLMSAYACEPGLGSEPGVGWNTAREMASYHDIWVITRANNRVVIEAELSERPIANLHFIYFDLPRWLRWWKRGQFGIHLYYYLWQIGIYFISRRWHQKVRFDLVHHVTFVRYWMPSFLVFLGVPFIWGPVGGGESAPKNFYKTFSWRGRIAEHLRDFARWLGERDPFVKLTAAKAQVAYATTPDTCRKIAKLGRLDTTVLSAIAINEDEFSKVTDNDIADAKCIVLCVGRLVDWKGFHLAIQAFGSVHEKLPDSELWIIGSGPQEETLRALASTLNLTEKIIFFGQLPRDQVFQRMKRASILLHPSLHDSGCWVCLEAMAAECCVLCLDIGGPATMVATQTGRKIPVFSPDQVINDLSQAIMELALNDDQRMSMCKAGREYALQNFTWKKVARHWHEEYKKLFNRLAME